MEIARSMNKKNNNFILLNIIATIFVLVLSMSIWALNLSYHISLILFGWLGNLILIWAIFIFRKIKGTHLNVYTFFFLSYFMFSYGQIFLYSIGAEYEKFNIIQIFPPNNVLLYCLFFCIGTCFFLLGALIAIRKDSSIEMKRLNQVKTDNPQLRQSIKIVAWIMFIVSSPVYIQTLISNMIKSINYGYTSIYEASDSSSISTLVESLSMWFIPSIFMLLVVYKNNRFIRNLIILIMLFVVIGIFITGARSRAMALIVSLLFLWNSEIKKFNKFGKINIIFVMVCVLSLLPIIQTFRGTESKTLEEFVILLQGSFNNNLIFEIIGELGGSMQPWLLVYDLVPNIQQFSFGGSYISAVLAVIPSILLGGFSFANYAQLSGWLQNAANMSYGPGFSILAESYYNFGWLGLVFLTIVGWMYFKFLSNNMFRGEIIIYKNTFSAIALYTFITTARGSVYLSIRTELYAILLPILAIVLIYNRFTRAERINKGGSKI